MQRRCSSVKIVQTSTPTGRHDLLTDPVRTRAGGSGCRDVLRIGASRNGSAKPLRETGAMASGEKRLRCVIVDDNPVFIEVATRLLERGEVTIIGVASTIAEALQRVNELRPDVTLVDVDLGGESGFQLAAELHRPNSHDAPKVILTSAHSEQDFADMIAASPAIGFLPKADLSSEALEDLLART
jgi:CheY-like chemotaxis protein